MNLTPYRVVAKKSLMMPGWGFELSEEEAEKVVETESFDELESKVRAKGSMSYAVEAIAKRVGSPSILPMLNLAVFGNKNEVYFTHEDSFKALGDFLHEKGFSTLDILAAVHDGWVKDHPAKFNDQKRVPKKYQHLPLEMIGWKEAKAALLFVEPILDAMRIKVNEKELEKEYEGRVVRFFNNKGLVNEKGMDKGAVARLIAKGHEFYAPLTEENSAKSKEEAELMASQVSEKLANINLKTKNL